MERSDRGGTEIFCMRKIDSLDLFIFGCKYFWFKIFIPFYFISVCGFKPSSQCNAALSITYM